MSRSRQTVATAATVGCPAPVAPVTLTSVLKALVKALRTLASHAPTHLTRLATPRSVSKALATLARSPLTPLATPTSVSKALVTPAGEAAASRTPASGSRRRWASHRP